MKRHSDHVRGQLLSEAVRNRARSCIGMALGAVSIGVMAGTAPWIRTWL